MVSECNVIPKKILALTFTRAATYGLRQEVIKVLDTENEEMPQISTLHSFALKQLLKNVPSITTVPKPLRIADDWEERWIIEEDLKKIMNLSRVEEVRDKFHQLSSDWQTLTAEDEDWEMRSPDPAFIGAWRKHRKIYGYMLRAELVYQLKKTIDQNPDFTFEQAYEHILVDEYQDLNRCDLAVVRQLSDLGGEIFATGDDDQSIYGFRFAHPEGIRRFDKDYKPCVLLNLEYCIRCDKIILQLGEFVASLDYSRILKLLKPLPEADDGQVKVLYFANQDEEANVIASICKHLIEVIGYKPSQILLLLRSDNKKAFSKPLCSALEALGVPVTSRANGASPFDDPEKLEGRQFLAVLHLCINPNDCLALRTLLRIRKNLIGIETIQATYQLADREGITFAEALRLIADSPYLLPRLGERLSNELNKINHLVSQFNADETKPDGLMDFFSGVAEKVIIDEGLRDEILLYLKQILEASGAKTPKELISALTSSLGDTEQEIDPNKVNILTMHQAKGLTADAVIMVAAEDEYIPGKQLGEKEEDERRLLYVSLTRARHALFITYCSKRTGPQRWTGRNAGRTTRNISRFLVDAPIKPESGIEFVTSII